MGDNVPPARAGHSAVNFGDKMIIFAGKDEDNNKLNDLWQFNFTNYCWDQIHTAEPPLARSGHSAQLYGNYMIIFGGIIEVTKELDDVILYDIKGKRWIQLFEELMLSPIKQKYGSIMNSPQGPNPSSPSNKDFNKMQNNMTYNLRVETNNMNGYFSY